MWKYRNSFWECGDYDYNLMRTLDTYQFCFGNMVANSYICSYIVLPLETNTVIFSTWHIREQQTFTHCDCLLRVMTFHTPETVLTVYSPVVYTSLRELANSDSWIWVRASATSLHVGLVRLCNHWSSTSTLHCSGSAEWWEVMSLSLRFGTPSASPSWYHLVMSTCCNWIRRLSRFTLLSEREGKKIGEDSKDCSPSRKLDQKYTRMMQTL